MKPGYIISAYKRPDLLIRLVKSLGSSPISIHIDKKSQIFYEINRRLGSLSNVTLLPRHVCYWGLFGHVQASIEGMKWFSKTSCDYAILLTGQCYPLISNDDIENELVLLGGKSLMETEKFPRPGWAHDNGGYKRVDRFYFSIDQPFYKKISCFDLISREVGRNELLRRVRGIRLWNRRPPLGLHLYGGSGYWCLSKECVDYVLEYIRFHPKIVRFFSSTFVPDEMFFQTILANSHLKNQLISSPVHYMDWSQKKANPAVLDEHSLSAAIASGAWFARKFEDVDVLDQLDRSITNKTLI
jgi:Core-2/I-Branching enzyme